MTLRPSIAHFIRVAEISIPSSSRTVSFGSRSSSSRVIPISSSVRSDVAAVEIAQPCPSKETSLTRPSSPSLMKTCCSSPQNGLVSSKSRS